MLEQIALAEELGFECFMFNEHHFLGYGGLIANPAVMLAAAAASTSRIRLGPCIAILSVRHPLQVAEDYAMVDAISGGRLEFGIGLGNTDLDYRVHEIPQAEGRARYQEAHDIIVKAWTEERFSHAGEFWRFEEITLYPAARAAAAAAHLGGGYLARRAWVGRPERLSHHDGRPSSSAGQGGRGGGGVARGSRGLGPRPGGLPLPIPPAHVRQRECAATAREIGQQDDFTLRGDLTDPAQGDRCRPGYVYDWEGMLETGRNLYGDPDQCIEIINNARRHYDFDTLTHNFNFGGLPHEEVKKSMRLFRAGSHARVHRLTRAMPSGG